MIDERFDLSPASVTGDGRLSHKNKSQDFELIRELKETNHLLKEMIETLTCFREEVNINLIDIENEVIQLKERISND